MPERPSEFNVGDYVTVDFSGDPDPSGVINEFAAHGGDINIPHVINDVRLLGITEYLLEGVSRDFPVFGSELTLAGGPW